VGDLEVDFRVSLGHHQPQPTPTPGVLVLHQSDNGKTVSVQVGQEVVVDLGSGYGTPYSTNPQVLAPVAEAVQPTPYPILQGGSGGGSGGSTGSSSASPGNFYCGVLPSKPTPQASSPAKANNCTPPCYCGTACGVQPMFCCNPLAGGAICPPYCPCGAYCAMPASTARPTVIAAAIALPSRLMASRLAGRLAPATSTA
jgi:hypothetical protein